MMSLLPGGWVLRNFNLYITVSQGIQTYSCHGHYNLKENKTWILRLCIYKRIYIFNNAKIYTIQCKNVTNNNANKGMMSIN